MSRTKKAMLNVSSVFVGQSMNFLISYFARRIFVIYIAKEFVGLDGLFTNLVQILSFFELGVGSAIVFSLYKPLAVNDVEKVKSLMQLYKKTYTAIGLFIFVAGAVMLPFIGLLVDVSFDLSFVRILFFLFVANTATSYFFSYRTSLIIADQKKYITSIINYTSRILLRVIQSIFLIITGNYVLYLIIQIVFTLLENILLSAYACYKYPYISDKNVQKLDDLEFKDIVKNIKALIMHRVGGTVYEGTDNILLSLFTGIVSVGTYMNYKLFLSAVTSIITQLFNSVMASMGNLNATENKDAFIKVFYSMTLACFWIVGFSAISLYCLLNTVIELSFGKDFIFQMSIVFSLVIIFYVNGIRNANLMAKGSLGLFWNDRYRPLIQAAVNLIVSIILAQHLGMLGIFWGTTISVVVTCTFYDAIILFRYGFLCSIKPYLKKFFFYNIAVLLAGLATNFACSFIVGATVKSFIFKIIICLIVPNVTFFVCFYKTDEFQYFFKLVKGLLNKWKLVR